jgi:hypothetical protein
MNNDSKVKGNYCIIQCAGRLTWSRGLRIPKEEIKMAYILGKLKGQKASNGNVMHTKKQIEEWLGREVRISS